MKKIKLNGKLNLNKETISKLNDPQMRDVKGGADTNSKYGCKTNLNCNTTNSVSWGHWCTKVDGCAVDDIETRGLFCVRD